MICPTGRADYFCVEDWTVESALIGRVKFDFWRNDFGRSVVIDPRHSVGTRRGSTLRPVVMDCRLDTSLRLDSAAQASIA
jgi:hypothetical protein